MKRSAKEKPVLRVLAGEAVWPPPVWLMRQAGRYLPEYRKVRSQAGDFISLCTTPVLAAEVTLQPIRRYGFDAAILFSDILMVPWALGQGLAFKEGEGPVLPPIRGMEGVRALDLGRLPGAIAPILETVERTRAGLPDQTTLIGFAGSPFTVACYMVEGGGSKDFTHIRGMAHSQPQVMDTLIDTLVEASVTYLSAQVGAGAEVLMLFDSWAGVLSPSLFRRLVIAPTKRIVARLHVLHPDVPIIGFPRLAGVMVGEYARDTGVNAVALDTGADIMVAKDLVPDGIATQGNLDPLAVVAGSEALRYEVAAVLAAIRGRPHIFNLGHGIIPQTPPEHVAALLEQVRAA
jgi:uroporphyrinogen decarboxylase